MSKALSFIFTEPTASEDTTNGVEFNVPFRATQCYFNNSDMDIVIKHRNNVSIPIKRELISNTSKRILTVRKIYTYKGRDNMHHSLTLMNNYVRKYGESTEIKLISHALKTAIGINNQLMMVHVNVDFHIDISVVKEKKAVYDKNLDLVICDVDQDINFPHPFSNEGRGVEEVQDYIRNKQGTGIFVEIIDNSSRIKNRYMYLGKKVVEISAVSDSDKAPGVYYTRMDHNRLDDINVEPIFLDYKAAEEELGIYRTYEDAATGGDPSSVNKVKLAELEHLSIIQKTDLAELRRKVEEEKAETLCLKEQYDREKLNRDKEMEHIRNEYDYRTMERKDSHELFKLLPTIVLAVATAISIFKK